MTLKFDVDKYLKDPFETLLSIKTTVLQVSNEVWNKNRMIDISSLIGAEPDNIFPQIDATISETRKNAMSLNCGDACLNMFMDHTEENL